MRWWAALLVVLVVSGCGEPAVTSTPASAVRLLALGDSYTIGESVDESERWPIQLADALEARGTSVEVEIVARTGWTTSELDAGIAAADPTGPFDVVTLLAGVNNQFRGLDVDDYRTEFADLLTQAVAFAGGDPSRVVVVSIPDWGVTPFGGSYDRETIGLEIDLFNEVGHIEALTIGAAWVDVTAISRSGAEGLIASDGLHPSADQYRRWVKAILPAVEEALSGE